MAVATCSTSATLTIWPMPANWSFPKSAKSVPWQSRCVTDRSANPRQLLAAQPVHDALAAKTGGHLDKMMGIFMDAADDGRRRPQRVRPHRRQQLFGIRFGADRHQFATKNETRRDHGKKEEGGKDKN
eukprot:TRINITY_DN16353_c0_g1_i1.p1 TRINITY_DN16353_c0_g1~~TRINITY_DN16353_c0_g1_i1.p1  ORF type:complete len:128 (-),score=0.18 TRINITY_DN16353_c0_g1_i1:26-409(-)